MISAGYIYLYNFTPVLISAVMVNGGASLGTIPAIQGQAIGTPLALDRSPFTGNGATLELVFTGGHAFSGNLTLPSQLSPAEAVQLVCVWNGFLCTDQYGVILQYAWG